MNFITPKITTGNLPASKKIYVKGNIHKDIKIPMREIALHPTAGEDPVIVYDSSGPYTDNKLSTDTPTKEAWGTLSKKDASIYYYKYNRKYPHHGTGNWVLF